MANRLSPGASDCRNSLFSPAGCQMELLTLPASKRKQVDLHLVSKHFPPWPLQAREHFELRNVWIPFSDLVSHDVRLAGMLPPAGSG